MLEFIPGKVFVVTVVSLIFFIGYSSQFCILLPNYEVNETIYLLGPLNILILLVFYNYYLAVVTDPGKIPAHWVQGTASSVEHINHPEATIAGIVDVVYSKWIITALGSIIVLGIEIMVTFYGLLRRIRAIMDAISHFQFNAEPISILSGYQFYCLLRNQTNIEAWERGKVEMLIQRGKILPTQYPYDIGLYINICQVLGPNPLLWLWPQRTPGDGLSFPVILGIDPYLPYHWPPRDPDDLRPSIFSSRYRRQQEAKRLLAENPSASIEDDSEGYYDSGSFVSDSDGYDEEEGTKHLLNNPLYHSSGVYYENPLHESSDEDIPLSNFYMQHSIEKKTD
ncbi:hypothetical protein G6F57_001720 [Rhizopus arrhizus]|uniref:Palmitoyltransferase PFA4 n=1 Tax=Rhizopus oryzae TaxID=64495 RepID=A0A9P6XHW5_RHIOR|nr:hypothetical protein G6F23_002355 [Rhizopus arrhizus]KAG1423130.1 hypothetical protein G6F58_002958 [Rhizopus delemar]KAG0949010.1 hypothetical protein G6F30_002448 [Rhizopus arrhizus]KAG0984475.1 hypothetical protein G6F29_004747 [Rhizopus arrhizus]KAG0996188.1 hypothetical protein G6F28_004082 [Rhizopus arrhizus]